MELMTLKAQRVPNAISRDAALEARNGLTVEDYQKRMRWWNTMDIMYCNWVADGIRKIADGYFCEVSCEDSTFCYKLKFRTFALKRADDM